MGAPALSLKPAMDLRARVTTGLCPEISDRSRTVFSRARVALVAYEHHVGDVQGRCPVYDARLAYPRLRFHVALQDVDAFNHHLPLARHHLRHGAPLALVLAGYDQDGIVFPYAYH